jgi:hypothetical protein
LARTFQKNGVNTQRYPSGALKGAFAIVALPFTAKRKAGRRVYDRIPDVVSYVAKQPVEIASGFPPLAIVGWSL